MVVKVCPKCDEDMTFTDDSFDYGEGHHGQAGTMVIQYWLCEHCGYDEDYEGEDYDYDYMEDYNEI